MADSYVCSGATMRCTMGTSQAKLTVLPDRVTDLTGKPMANISDHKTMVNLGAFGRCRSMGFPATASATAAAQGTLTPMPCMHNTPFPWMGGKLDYHIKGQPALLKSCKCQCMWGGTISITDDGQHGEGTQWVQKKEKESFETNQSNADNAPKVYSDSNQKATSRANTSAEYISQRSKTQASKKHFIKKALIEQYKDYISKDLTKEDLAKAILQKNVVTEDEKEKLWRELKKARRNYAKDFYLKNSNKKDRAELITIASIINGIDFNFPVEESELPPPNIVCRYEAFHREPPSFEFVFEMKDDGTFPTQEEVVICNPVVVIDEKDHKKKKIYKGLYKYSIDGPPRPCLKSTTKLTSVPIDDKWLNRKRNNRIRYPEGGGAKQIACPNLTKTSGIQIKCEIIKERKVDKIEE